MMNNKKLVLDIGSGTGSSTKIWTENGYRVISVDYNKEFNPTILGDYGTKEVWEKINSYGQYDFIWFSPDCRFFSLAGKMPFDKHRNATTVEAEKVCTDNCYVLDNIMKINPKLGWIMENPRALMRKMPWVQEYHRVTISFCQYGDTRMKPTDLFGNIPIDFIPKFCKNGAPCHEPAPRGSKTGTQGLKNSKLRSMVPYDLTKAIFEAAQKSNGVFYYGN